MQITANLVRDQRGGAIELGFGAASDSYTNITIANNTVADNGFNSGSTPSPEPVGVAAWNFTGSAVGILRNVIVSVGSLLTSTATLGGQTSEFGGNVIVTTGPSLLHLKSAAVLSDPVNDSTNPKSIPGAVQLYTLRITNQGAGAVDNDSLMIADAIPDNTAMYVMDASGVGSGPVAFVDGSPTSALTYTFTALNSPADHLEFSNDNGSSWNYMPTPDADGYDPAVTHIRVRPQGSMVGNGAGGNPSFELRFRVRVE